MNIFTKPVTEAYDLTDATWEIIIMLLVAFILGWLFHYLWSRFVEADTYAISEDIPQKFVGIGQDNLKLVEGIGPKIEELLKNAGIMTWGDIASSDIKALKAVLTKGGDRFQMHDPSSWADQAALAVEGKWAELEEYQELLIGGRTK